MASSNPLAAARRIAETLSAGAEEAERERTLPEESVAALRDAGLFALLVPRELGGLEVDLPILVEVVEELARADASAGWCLGNSAIGAGMSGAHLGDDAVRKVFAADGNVPMAGGFTPRNRATPTAGGYRVDGRWPFGSGCRHADWMIATCLVAEEGEGVLKDGGMTGARVFVLPRARVELHDNWYAAGLEGTASCDYTVADTFVAADYSFPLAGSEPQRGGALYRVPLLSWAAAVQSGFALGVGHRSLEEIASVAKGRQRLGNARRLVDDVPFQRGYGHAAAKLRAARCFALDAFSEVSRSAEVGDPVTPERRANALLAAVHANRTAADVASFAFHAAGAGAVLRSHPLQRCFRDIHAAGQHIVVGEEGFERGAQVLLGFDPHPML